MTIQFFSNAIEPAADDAKTTSEGSTECSTMMPTSPVSASTIVQSAVVDACTDDILDARVDAFDVHSVLGKGSFGTVYRVTHKRTRCSYAMKVMDKEIIFEEDRLGLAITELKVQSSMQHPFIVRLACSFQTVHELVLVMQFCPGGTLKKFVEGQDGLSEELSRLYFSEVFLAIEHMHSCEVAYRDLKCENVVLDEFGHAMLMDFGLCKQKLSGIKRSNSFVGTPRFMSPEVLCRQCHGKEVDIYGLGVLLFEMLTTYPPFSAADAQDRQQLVHMVLNSKLEIPSFVSCGCASILGTLLERDPQRRLGATDTADIRSHPFLAPVDFDALLIREVPLTHFQPCRPVALDSGSSSAGDRTALPNPFSNRTTIASLLGATYVQGWEFPAPKSKPHSNVTASTPSSPVRLRPSTWQTSDFLPLSQMHILC